jgi:hypothetical protein
VVLPSKSSFHPLCRSFAVSVFKGAAAEMGAVAASIVPSRIAAVTEIFRYPAFLTIMVLSLG